MIKNRKQYLTSKKELKKFKDVLDLLSGQEPSDIHPLLIKAQSDSIKSQIEELEGEISEFERLSQGEVPIIKMGLSELSMGIIASRISRGYTHSQLGVLLGVSEQQVQKYESDNFQNTSLKRLTQIVEVLNVSVDAQFNLKQEKAGFNFLDSDSLNSEIVESKIKERGTTFEMCP